MLHLARTYYESGGFKFYGKTLLGKVTGMAPDIAEDNNILFIIMLG